MTKRTLLATAAVAAVLSIGAAQTARAVPAYAYGNLTFTDFALTGVVGAPGVTINTATVQLKSAADYPVGTSPAGSSVSGTLAAGADVPQAKAGIGAFPAENTYTAAMLGQSGTRGDGRITGAISGNATSELVSEGNLTPFGATASSNAGSSTILNLTFTVVGTQAVDLLFNASAAMSAFVGALGDAASEQISASFVIHNITTNTDVCISDVTAGGSCTTKVEPSQLNHTISASDPLSPLSFSATMGDGTLAGRQHYQALLGSGQYQLTLSDSTTTILSTAAAVPEPVSFALLGTGLIALGAIRRRRKN